MSKRFWWSNFRLLVYSVWFVWVGVVIWAFIDRPSFWRKVRQVTGWEV